MSIILKSAKVINASKYNSTEQDILISEGKIVKIAKSIEIDSAQVIKIENLHVSVDGWIVVYHLGNLVMKKEKL